MFQSDHRMGRFIPAGDTCKTVIQSCVCKSWRCHFRFYLCHSIFNKHPPPVTLMSCLTFNLSVPYLPWVPWHQALFCIRAINLAAQTSLGRRVLGLLLHSESVHPHQQGAAPQHRGIHTTAKDPVSHPPPLQFGDGRNFLSCLPLPKYTGSWAWVEREGKENVKCWDKCKYIWVLF